MHEKILKKAGGVLFFFMLVGIIFWIIAFDQHRQGKDIFVEAPVEIEKVYFNFIFDQENIVSLEFPYSEQSSSSLLTITRQIAQEQDWTFASQDYGELGVLVTQIGAKENGQEQKYWQYFVDGVQPLVAVDQYTPKANTQIEWRFAESVY